MKKVFQYFILGLAIAFACILFSDVFADIFNGLPYGTGAIIGMGAFLCVIVITCTGIIVSKIDGKEKDDNEKNDPRE